MAEIAAFLCCVQEYEKKRTVCCVLCANMVSLLAGGAVISHLPV